MVFPMVAAIDNCALVLPGLSEKRIFQVIDCFLSSQSKRIDDGTIPLDILTFYIIQKSAASAY